MRLEDDVNLTVAALASCCEGRGDFCGVVAIVIDHGHSVCLAAKLEAAVDSVEIDQALGDLIGGNLKLAGDRNRGRRVEDVVAARHAELEWTERAFRRPYLKA